MCIRDRSKKEILNSRAPRQQASARNLLNYVILRSLEIRQLQDDLHEAGLSSLANSESHVLGQIQSVLQRLGKQYEDGQRSPNSYQYSRERINENSRLLLVIAVVTRHISWLPSTVHLRRIYPT